MSGTVVGGWEFVGAAYVVTLAALGGYVVSVLQRYRAERRRAAREERP
jgi:heme exporter protein CcmD